MQTENKKNRPIKRDARLPQERGNRRGRSRARDRRQRRKKIWKAAILFGAVGLLGGALLFAGSYLISPKTVIQREEARVIEGQTLPQDGEDADAAKTTEHRNDADSVDR